MSRLFDYYALVLGRILVGGYFLWNGILFAINLQKTANTLASVHLGVDPVWIVVLIVAIEVLGGMAIIIDWKMRYFALALALYLIAATALFQSTLPDSGAASLFLKNMALIGALLYISATSA